MPSSFRQPIEIKYTNTLSAGLDKFFRTAGISPNNTSGADRKAKTDCGLQFINFTINGSSNELVRPPIWWGNLRAAGSVHVGSEFVGGNNLYPVKTTGGKHESTSANTASISEKPDTITIGFNTAYATRMHETDWKPGPISKLSGNTGKKFLEKHLIADREDIIAFYAKVFENEIAKQFGRTTQ